MAPVLKRLKYRKYMENLHLGGILRVIPKSTLYNWRKQIQNGPSLHNDDDSDQIDNQSSSATGVLHLNGETCNGAVHHLGETSTATMSQSDDNPTTDQSFWVNNNVSDTSSPTSTALSDVYHTVHNVPSDQPCWGGLIDDRGETKDASVDAFGDRGNDDSYWFESLRTEGRKKIHASLSLTKGELMSLVLAFKVTQKLTNSGFESLLRLLNIIVPDCTPKNKYFFDKMFKENKLSSIKVHYQCPICKKYLGSHQESDVMKNCTTCRVKYSNGDLERQNSFFLYSSMKEQFKNLLETSDLWDQITENKRNVFRNQNSNEVGEVFTGDLYKQSDVMSFLSQGDNFTATFGTDGFRVTKSSRVEIWPLTVTVNEVSVLLKSKFLLLVSLWSGVGKPTPETFLKPFVEEARTLEKVGVTWTRHGISRVSKIRFLLGVMDAPARAMVTNIHQYNGLFGCGWCLVPGFYIPKGDGQSRIFPLKFPIPPRRTLEGTLTAAKLALEFGVDHINGVKGLSQLYLLPGFDIIRGVVPDYMHCLLIGVCLQFLKLWLTTVGAPYYIKNPAQLLIDELLKSVQPPNEMGRIFRSLVQFLYQWKASELRNWLLFYSPVVLKSFLPSQYYRHWLLLVRAFRILLCKNLKKEEIPHAKLLVFKFVGLVPELYGVELCTYNLHILLHVVEAVEYWGSPWAYSAFLFEDIGGLLKKEFHGTTYISKQIFSNFLARRNFRNYSRMFIPYADENVQSLYEDFDSPLTTDAYVSRCKFLGAQERYLLTASEFIAVEQHLGVELNCQFAITFHRICVKGIIYSSKCYSSKFKRSNSVVSHGTDGSDISEIIRFVFVDPKCCCRLATDDDGQRNVCLLGDVTSNLFESISGINMIILAQKLTLSPVPVMRDSYSELNLASFMKKVNRNCIPTIMAFTPNDIKFKCVLIPDSEGSEICVENDVVFEKD